MTTLSARLRELVTEFHSHRVNTTIRPIVAVEICEFVIENESAILPALESAEQPDALKRLYESGRQDGIRECAAVCAVNLADDPVGKFGVAECERDILALLAPEPQRGERDVPALNGPYAKSGELGQALGLSPTQAQAFETRLERLAGNNLKTMGGDVVGSSVNPETPRLDARNTSNLATPVAVRHSAEQRGEGERG